MTEHLLDVRAVQTDARSEMAEELEAATNTVTRVPLERAKQMTSRMALQSATSTIHQRLHQHPGLARLAAGTIGRDEYRRLLGRSYGFYVMAEPLLGFASRLTDCLAQDLTDLGVGHAEVAELPRCTAMTVGHGHAETIGSRYVLIGASLGGKVMAKAIARHDATLPVRFLTGLGENDWKDFVSELEANLPDAGSRTRAAKAAAVTFAAYEDWMAGHE